MFVAVLALSIGCGQDLSTPSDVGLEASQSALLGGTPTSADPEVFALLISGQTPGSTSICTATLIGEKTLLTAGHCLYTNAQATIVATNDPSVNESAQPKRYRVVQTRVYPGFVPLTLRHDIALAVLDSAPGVAPKRLSSAKLEGLSGNWLRAVGYGTTDPRKASDGIKRTASLILGEVKSSLFDLASPKAGICFGDSGGPAFFTFGDGHERLVGIHSYDATGDCQDGVDTRVDSYFEWISTELARLEPKQAPHPAKGLSCGPCPSGTACTGDAPTLMACRPVCNETSECGGTNVCTFGFDGVKHCAAPLTVAALSSTAEGPTAAGCTHVSAAPLIGLAWVLARRKRQGQR